MSIKKESNLSNKIVYDLTPFSHIDYPNHLACIVWLIGCNMRCKYCYNKDIVKAKKADMTFNDILLFLEKRKNLLDGIVISGGESTMHDLSLFCEEVKKLGFKVKLDTNGTNFKQIKELIDLKLVDYIALDYKAPKYKFKDVTELSTTGFDVFEKTLDYLIKSDIELEVRTTIHRDLLTEEDINLIISDLKKRGYNKKYNLQEFLETDNNMTNLKASKKKFDFSNIDNSLGSIF